MEADWSREHPTRYWDPSRRLLQSIRRYQAAKAASRGLAARWWVLHHRFWSAITGAEIPINARIGGGLSIPHPNGIVINAGAVVGTNCLIMHQVTLGSNGGSGVPVIGDGVDLGPGAKLLGPISVGDGAMVGAMSLVLADVAPDAIVSGIPARPTGRSAAEVRAGFAARP